MTALLELMRPFVCLAAAGGAFAGLGAVAFPPTDYRRIALTLLSASLMMGAACALNDVFDADIDAVNAPGRPIPSGRVSRREALAWALFLFVASDAAGWGVSPALGCLALLQTAAYAGYDWGSKRLGMGKDLAAAAAACSLYLDAGAAAGHASPIFWTTAVFSFLMMLAVELVKDVADERGDRAGGARTWALAAGGGATLRAAEACVAAALALALGAGLAGWTRGMLWPLLAGAAAFGAAAFTGFPRVRPAILVTCAAALGVAGLVRGAL